MTRRTNADSRTARSALAVAIERSDWELAALLLLDRARLASRAALPPGTIDDVLALHRRNGGRR